MPQNNFSKVLLAAVEESLSSLGDSPKQAVFYHLECSFKIKRENIATNLTEFTKALEGMFGPGAAYLEDLITKRLYEKLGMKMSDDTSCSGFVNCIDVARQRLMPDGECSAW